MTDAGALPSVDVVKAVLAEMLDVEVGATASPTQAPDQDVVAVYVDKVGILRAAAVADVAAAASLGAALTRIPPSTVKECVATRATARMDLVIATPNYPDGRLSLVLAGWPAGGRSAPPLPQEDAATTHSVANCSSFRPSA